MMDSCHLVRAADVAPQPWRNGGGRTRELLAWPDARDPRLRVSLADIERDGPFSAYDGRRRWFAVVEGAGVRLDFGDAGVRAVTPHDAPLQFDGALAPACRLIDGRTRDLNLMHRDGQGSMIRVDGAGEWQARADQCGLFAAVDGRWRCADGRHADVPALSLLWLPNAPAGSMSFTAARPAHGPVGWWLAYTSAEDRP